MAYRKRRYAKRSRGRRAFGTSLMGRAYRRRRRQRNPGGRYNRSGLRRGVEIKYIDTPIQLVTAGTASFGSVYYDTGAKPALVSPNTANNTYAGYYCLNAIGTGTDATNRIGRRVLMKHIFIRLAFQLGSGQTAINPANARVILCLDRQPNSTAYTLDVLLSALLEQGSSANGLVKFYSPVSLANRARFKIITDKIISLQTAQGTGMVQKKFYKKLYTEVTYSGAQGTPTEAEIAKNKLLLIIIGDWDTATHATLCPLVGGYARLRFIDP